MPKKITSPFQSIINGGPISPLNYKGPKKPTPKGQGVQKHWTGESKKGSPK